MSCKRTRRTAGRRSTLKAAARRPGKTQFGTHVIDEVSAAGSSPSDLAQLLDREWFRSHPYRSHRLRRAIPGEIPCASAETYIVVRQVAPGLRARGSFDPVGSLPSDEAPEHIAHAMFDLIMEFPGRLLPLRELFQRSPAYEVVPDLEDPSRDKPLRRH